MKIPLFFILLLVAVVRGQQRECMEASILISADGSDSINPADFVTQLEFIKRIQSLAGGTNLLFGVHIFSSSIASAPDGTITIKARATRRFGRLVDQLVHPKQGTDTALAIREAVRALNRAGTLSKTLIIITDGRSVDETATIAEADAAKRQDIVIIAIGVGPNVNMAELNGIATSVNNVFEVSDFSALDAEINNIQNKVCVDITTTTTTTTPAPTQPPQTSGFCTDCNIDSGSAYFPYPNDCGRFVQCSFNLETNSIDEFIMPCGDGTVWNQPTLTCISAEEGTCPYCTDSSSRPKWDNCRAYYQCLGNQDIAFVCCRQGRSFSASRNRCVVDDTCRTTCPRQTEQILDACSVRQAMPGDRTKFMVQDNGEMKNMDCPPGTLYDSASCECIDIIAGFTQDKNCKADLILNFDDQNIVDLSANKNWLEIQNVEIVDSSFDSGITGTGAARFNGDGMIRINFFSNIDWRDTVVISFRFKSDGGRGDEALLVNLDCNEKPNPSIAVLANRNEVMFGVDTDDAAFKMMKESYNRNVWNSVQVIIENGEMRTIVNGVEVMEPLTGVLEKRASSLLIGRGDKAGYANYSGLLDDLTVLRCMPPTI